MLVIWAQKKRGQVTCQHIYFTLSILLLDMMYNRQYLYSYGMQSEG